MRSSILAITCAAGFVLGATQASAQWFDQFDTYVLGPLAPQGNWEEWDGASGVNPDVVNTLSLTPEQCVKITGQPVGGGSGNDVVYDFVHLTDGQPTSGSYVAYTRVYVPSTATGVGWFIMLNRYPALKNWSVQVQFDADTGVVHAAQPAGTDLTLVYDTWMPLITCIDLDTDRLDIFYGTDRLCENQPWISGGSARIACIDLYGGEPAGGGISELYYDNVSLEEVKIGGPVSLVSSPAPFPDGTSITMHLDAPTLPFGAAGIFLKMPFSVLLVVPLDFEGKWSVTSSLPPGLSGAQVEFFAFAEPAGGGQQAQSNTELVVFQ